MSKNGAFARGIIVGWFIATVFFVFVPTAHCQTPTPTLNFAGTSAGRITFQDPTFDNWMARKRATVLVIPPLPGWWRYGNQYLPCNYLPYGTQTTANPGGGWLDPTNGLPFYARYDTAAMQFFPNHAPDGTYEGQGGPNHTDQYLVGGRFLPFNPGDSPPPPWWYPAPVASGVCSLFLSYAHNSGRSCPTDTEAHYTTQTLSNPVWQESWAAIKPQHDADCNNPGPTWTPTRTTTPTPPPVTPTPSQGDPTMGRYVAWLNQKGITGGCSTTLFCPTTDVQRQQMAVFLYKLYKLDHPNEPLPPCPTPAVFNDVPCQ